MMNVIRGSIASNPVSSNIDITNKATDFAWFAFAAMLVGAIALLLWGSRLALGQRSFHHLSAAICGTAAIAYFCIASDLGSTPIRVEFIRAGQLGQNYVRNGIASPTRSIWYVRYIDWAITTPLLLLDLLLSTALPLSEIFFIIFIDIVMIVTGLVASLVHSQYKWGLFAMGLAAQFYIWWALLLPGRASAYRLGNDFGGAYLKSAIILSSLWLFYPLIFGLADGGNIISPDAEIIWYGCIDILAKPVFCAIHCHALSRCDYARLGLSSGKFSSAMEDVSLTNGAHVGANNGSNGVFHDKSNVNGTTGVNGGHHTGVNSGVGTGTGIGTTGTGLGAETTGTGVGHGVGHHGVVGHNTTTGTTV